MNRMALFGLVIALLVTTLGCSGKSPGSPAERAEGGEDGFTAVARALASNDLDEVATRLVFTDLQCGLPIALPDGEVPGPACAAAEAPGTLVMVFPIVSCDVRFVPAAEAREVVIRSLAKFEVYGGIKLAPPNARQRHYALQQGVYGVVGKVGGSAALMVSVSSQGDIVNLWPGCGEFAAGFMDERFRETVLFGPP